MNIQKWPYLGKNGVVTHWMVVELGADRAVLRRCVVEGVDAAHGLMKEWHQ